jgi:hypothetical protein
LYWLTIPSGFAAKKKRQSPAELVNNNYTIPSTSRQLAMADIFSERLKAVRERRGYSQAEFRILKPGAGRLPSTTCAVFLTP